MSDRFECIVVEPRDHSLPLDVQGVALRRKAIEAMKDLGTVDENSVRYKAGTEDATIHVLDNFMSLWQRDLFAALFYADGNAEKDREWAFASEDEERRRFTSVKVNRDPYAA